MQEKLRAFGVLAMLACFGLSTAFAANGSWKFGSEPRGHPELIYSENGKTIFMVACGRAFGIHAVYPGAPKKDGEKATITISNARSKMTFRGEIASGYDTISAEGRSYKLPPIDVRGWEQKYKESCG